MIKKERIFQNKKTLSLLILFFMIFLILIFINTNIVKSTEELNIEDLETEEFEIEFAEPLFSKHENYDIVMITETSSTTEVGSPMLPIKSISILINNEDIEKIEIISFLEKSIPGTYKIFPTQVPLPIIEEKIKKRREIKFTPPNPTVYKLDTFPKEGLFKKVGISKIRDYYILDILVYPIQYNPKEGKLTFYKKIKFKITYKSPKITEIEKRIHRSKHFDKIVKTHVINPKKADKFYEEIEEIKKFKGKTKITGFANGDGAPLEAFGTPTNCTGLSFWTESEIKYVIITNETFRSEFQRLADWKTKKGVYTKVVNISFITSNCTGTDNQEKLRNFVKDVYSVWSVEWILLGGDTDVIPYRQGRAYSHTITTDLYYADLNGSWDADDDGIYGEVTDNINLYADVFIGRAPINNITEAQTFVNKTLFYEKTPTIGYLEKALLFAEYARLDPLCDCAVLAKFIDTRYISNYSDFTVTGLYESEGNENSTLVIAELNKGYNLAAHGGHAGYTSLCVGTDSMSRDDVSGLTNDKNYSIVYSLGCYPNQFEYDSISERFILNQNGGGIAFIGNTHVGYYSTGVSTVPGCNDGTCMYSGEYMFEFYKSLFEENFTHIGEVLTDSKNAYVGYSGSDWVYRHTQYALNLLGDPEVQIWTKTPQNFSISFYPETITDNLLQLIVNVRNSTGGNIGNATVCLQKGTELYVHNTTDSNGNTTLNLSGLTETGTINVTTTKHNFIPNETTIEAVLEEPVVTLVSPSDNYYTSNISITFNCSATDGINLENISLYHNISGSFVLNQTTNITGTYNSSIFKINATANLAFTWNCLACDNDSNSDWGVNRSIITDTINPSLYLGPPANNTINTTTSYIDFYYNVSDKNIDNCSLIIDDVINITESNPTNNINVQQNLTSHLKPGIYNWNINCTDKANNVNKSEIRNISIVDLTDPIVNLNSPTNNSNISNNVTFNFIVTEDNIDSCMLYGNWTTGWHLNQTLINPSTDTIVNFAPLIIEDNYYIWNVQCNDTSGNSAFNKTNFTFTLDAVAPEVHLISPTNASTWTSSQTVTFTYNVTDANAIHSCSLIIYSNVSLTDTTITKNATQEFIKSLSNRNYYWAVDCIDFANNQNSSETRKLTVSYSPPSGGGGGGGGGTTLTETIIPQPNIFDISSGLTKGAVKKDLKTNDSIKFKIKEKWHKVKIYTIFFDRVELEISSNTFYQTLWINKIKYFDLDKNGQDDLLITLLSIDESESIAKLKFELLKEIIPYTEENISKIEKEILEEKPLQRLRYLWISIFIAVIAAIACYYFYRKHQTKIINMVRRKNI